MKKILGRSFFNRSTPIVARELIGKFLVRRIRGKQIVCMIIETEAYHGYSDKASHAHRGKTSRNVPMFASPGTTYVYYTYGMHWMLNIVCGKEGFPAAVLIRGAGNISGPARLTKALKINKLLNGKMLGESIGLWIEDRGIIIPRKHICRTARVGIDRAEEWVKKPWRFVFSPRKK